MMVAGVLSCGHAWQKKRRKISGSGEAAKIAFGLGGGSVTQKGRCPYCLFRGRTYPKAYVDNKSVTIEYDYTNLEFAIGWSIRVAFSSVVFEIITPSGGNYWRAGAYY